MVCVMTTAITCSSCPYMRVGNASLEMSEFKLSVRIFVDDKHKFVVGLLFHFSGLMMLEVLKILETNFSREERTTAFPYLLLQRYMN